MGWDNLDGIHEGWAAAEFTGDRFATGSGGGGARVRHFGPGPLRGQYTGEPEIVDGRTAIGWRGLCECGWRGPLWVRVERVGDAESAGHKVYAPGLDQYGDAAEWVEDAIYREWRDHLEPEHLAAVRAEARAVNAAQTRLTDAVHAAKAAGASWADIGGAVGITRQSAHERWGRPVPDRAFAVGDVVRLLTGQHVSYIDEDLEAEGEDATMRFRVRAGEVCRVVKVREYVTPFPYVVRRGDGREFGVAEHDLERVAED